MWNNQIKTNASNIPKIRCHPGRIYEQHEEKCPSEKFDRNSIESYRIINAGKCCNEITWWVCIEVDLNDAGIWEKSSALRKRLSRLIALNAPIPDDLIWIYPYAKDKCLFCKKDLSNEAIIDLFVRFCDNCEKFKTDKGIDA